MPRPITFTEEMKQKARDDFNKVLDGVKMSDGKLSYHKNYTYKDGKAVVWLSPEAHKKTLALVTEFSDEVGWHGTASRIGDDEFVIEDVFVYPQEVTGSTVNTGQKEYTGWLYELDDETFNKIRMQGHSHVNMGVSPSGVDDKHRAQILEQLEPDMFYIFMVWNKRLETHTLVYDMGSNILYEDKDVDVRLSGGGDMEEFLTDAKEKVRKKTYGNKKNKAEGKKQSGEQLELDACLDVFGDYTYHGPYGPYD